MLKITRSITCNGLALNKVINKLTSCIPDVQDGNFIRLQKLFSSIHFIIQP